MDTKLKSSKKFSYIIVAFLILAEVAGFLCMYPFFEKRAEDYYTDYLHSEEFLQELYQSNCVLYKDIQERVQGQSLRYQDLFLEINDEAVDNPNMDVEYTEENTELLKQQAASRMEELLQAWQSHMLYGLAREIDYCVIDHITGQSMKNTGGKIEKLGEGQSEEQSGEPAGEQDEEYPYYVRLSYDSAGNLEDVSVKSTRSDTLLKNAQSVMRSNWLENNFWGGLGYTYEIYRDGSLYYYDINGSSRKNQTIVHNSPKDTTFIYALTKEQENQLLSVWKAGNLGNNEDWDEENAYYKAGVMNFYFGLLVVLTVAAFLLTRCRKYCLHKLLGTDVHPEISLLALFFMVDACGQSVVGLVNFTNRGYFDQSYMKYLTHIPENTYSVITIGINVFVLTLIFCCWYYFVTSLTGFFSMGPVTFIKRRSLLYHWWCNGKGFIGTKVKRFRDEVLHVDLGRNGEKTIRKLVIVNFLILAAMCIMWVFGWAALIIYSIILYFCLRKYVQKIQEQYQKLLDATSSISDGNLQTEFDGDWGVFESYKKELNEIQNSFRKAVDEEVKSQKMKTELISNVSHDLKTPLTAITTYTELLKNEDISAQQRKEYLEVLEKKSLRLKFLIEDLFEVSKASSGNVPLTLMNVDICNLIRQVYLEHEDKAGEAGLVFRFQMPEEKVILNLDSQKTFRIFENLYTNILKYAMPNTRVYVKVEQTEDGVRIEMKNTSATELNILPQDLTERFVRGDSSRNTEGSGLGLTIAKSFTELQGGRMNIEIDGDLFKVVMLWGRNVIICNTIPESAGETEKKSE